MHYLDYNEKQAHGTADFPLAYYYVDEHHPRYHMPFHWHRETELLRVLEGQLRLSLDDREYVVSAGELICISEGVIHGGEPENCIYECAVFDPQPLLMHTHAVRSYLYQIQRRQIQIVMRFTKKQPEILTCADTLYHSLRKKGPGWEMTSLGALFELYGLIFDRGYYTPCASRDNTQGKLQQLKPVLEYIELNYQSPITLEDLSRLAGMSSKYFCRFFRAVIHRTPIDYLNYYRIERACYLMAAEGISVTEAAYQCGFNDSSYFVRAFRKYRNVTPRQYLNRLESSD